LSEEIEKVHGCIVALNYLCIISHVCMRYS